MSSKKRKKVQQATGTPTSDIVSVGVEVIEPEPTDDMGWIRWWLTAISETDQGCREEVRDQCKADAEAKSFYVMRAKELWADTEHVKIVDLALKENQNSNTIFA